MSDQDPDQVVAPTGEAAAASAPQEGADAGGEPRRDGARRRNRRRGGRAQREGAPQAAQGGADADAGSQDAQPEQPGTPRPQRAQRPPRQGAGQPQGGAKPARDDKPAVRIEEVVSGDFDRAVELADQAEPGVRRVLAPSPEAPKLHKVLAQGGIGSRREMEELIQEGRVSVNGEPAHLGQRIQPGDQIRVNGKPLKIRIAPPPARMLVYHKPVGEVVTFKDPDGRPTVFRNLPRVHNAKWTAVGRLDINTEGLLLLTTSGELANKLMHPSQGVEREYAVRVLGQLDDTMRQRLLEGVELSDGPARFLSLEEAGGEGANRWWRAVISEGRNREVRRLFEAVGLTVSRLIRVRYGSIALPAGLRRGDFVEIDRDDMKALMSGAGLTTQPARRKGGRGAPAQPAPAGRRKGGERAQRADRGERGQRAQRVEQGERPEPRGEREPGPNSYQMSAVDALFGRASREARLASMRNKVHDEDADLPEREPGPNSYAMSAVDALFGRGGGGARPRGGPGGGGSGGGGGGGGGPRAGGRSRKGGGGGGKGGGKGPRQPDPTRSALGIAPSGGHHGGGGQKRRGRSR